VNLVAYLAASLDHPDEICNSVRILADAVIEAHVLAKQQAAQLRQSIEGTSLDIQDAVVAQIEILELGVVHEKVPLEAEDDGVVEVQQSQFSVLLQVVAGQLTELCVRDPNGAEVLEVLGQLRWKVVDGCAVQPDCLDIVVRVVVIVIAVDFLESSFGWNSDAVVVVLAVIKLRDVVVVGAKIAVEVKGCDGGWDGDKNEDKG
jgi:hypothetical protein